MKHILLVSLVLLSIFAQLSNAKSEEQNQLQLNTEDKAQATTEVPQNNDVASIRRKGRMVIMVNKNLLTDTQGERNPDEEATKRHNQDIKAAQKMGDVARQQAEQNEKQADEQTEKKHAQAKKFQAEEQNEKLQRRQRAEDEQKQKQKLVEGEQKDKDRAREQQTKEAEARKQKEDKQKKQAQEQEAKSEQGNKKAAEENQKQDPCFETARKFVPNGLTKTFEVNAMKHSVQGSGYPLDTGIYIKRGSALSSFANGMWNAAVDALASDANGLTNLPLYNYMGLNARYGSLVGRIGTGAYFVLGSDFFNCKMEQEGRLFLAYWDSDSDNNRNSINVKIQYTKAKEEDEPCFQKKIDNAFVRAFSVDAKGNSVGEAGVPLFTGAYISRGTPLRVVASGEWYASWNNDLYSNPNGRNIDWNGLRFFSLVGRIGGGGWFFIGEDFFHCNVPQEGFLQLAYWDVNSGDNRGSVRATVSYTRSKGGLEDDCSRKTISNGISKTVRVFARENSVSGGAPMDSGVDITSAPLKVVADGTWYAAQPNQLAANPNGWDSLYGTQGSTLRAFSLVARIGNGPWFFVGSDYYNCAPQQNGRLYFGYWDSDAANNSGYVSATVTVAPPS